MASSNQCRAGAPEPIKYNLSWIAGIAQDIADEVKRFNCRVPTKLHLAPCLESVGPGIGPQVRTVPAIGAELDIVNMGTLTLLVDCDQFMLGAIQRTHTRIALCPNAQVKPVIIDSLAGTQKFGQMPPVHKHIVQRPIAARLGHGFQRAAKELRKFV